MGDFDSGIGGGVVPYGSSICGDGGCCGGVTHETCPEDCRE